MGIGILTKKQQTRRRTVECNPSHEPLVRRARCLYYICVAKVNVDPPALKWDEKDVLM